jgi:hypothetical protein
MTKTRSVHCVFCFANNTGFLAERQRRKNKGDYDRANRSLGSTIIS